MTVSGVVVTQANPPQDGVLESNEQLVLSWAVNGADSIGGRSLTIDGTAVSTLYGPYSASGGAYCLSGVFGPLAAGSHTYSIQSADSNGNVGTASGTFNVVAGSSVTVSGVVVTQANPPQDGVLESNEQLVLSWAVERRRQRRQPLAHH